MVDCGGSGCCVAPVVDGYVLRRPIQRSNRGGIWLSEQLQEALEAKLGKPVTPRYAVRRKRSASGELVYSTLDFPDTHPTYERQAKLWAVDSVKEAMCGLPLWRMPDEVLAPHLPLPRRPAQYELPDGTVVEASPDIYRVPERLFDRAVEAPAAAGGKDVGEGADGRQVKGGLGALSGEGLHQMVYDSISACDVDIRKEVISNMVLTGATSQLPYLPERLHREITSLLPTVFKAKVVAPEPIERRYGVWIGGSILCSLGSFQQLWLSKAEYEELGPILSDQRFFQ